MIEEGEVLDLDLPDQTGTRRSVAELMAGLNGRASLVVGKGRIDNQYIDLIGADPGAGGPS